MPVNDNGTAILKNRVLVDVALDPISRKIYLEIEPPSLSDNQADLDRVMDELNKNQADVTFPLGLMNKASDVLHQANWQATFTLALFGGQWQVIDVEPGNQTTSQFGLAVDIGTTTVVGYLVDLTTGGVLGTAADYNGQIRFGDDILSRIQAAGDPLGRQAMQYAVVETLNDIIKRLAEQQQIDNLKISAVTVGANTTMVHLLLGLDPGRICMAPYTPMVNRPGYIKASEIGLTVNPEAPLYCLPGVGSYVGGDIIGGVLASGMHKKPEVALFVDIGTNGEMVLGGQEWLTACAGAAGPALEGGVARHGMRAEPGAVYQVRIDQVTDQVQYQTMGGQKAVGICGSGLIDCLAELLLAGVIDRAGKFRDGRKEFVLVP
ncbi:MAG: ASKHA domain-containing protein, partial [Desulfotomaculaceae bacterium]